MSTSSSSRRMRAFRRWMRSQSISHTPAIDFVDSGVEGIWVRALCNLREGDVIATIPKEACLTVKTSGAHSMIVEAGLGGILGLSVVVMYERSRGDESPWAGYLQLLPEAEQVPLTWSVREVDDLLVGTELHKAVKEDKVLVYEDWKENILPLMDFEHLKLNPRYFGFEQYIAARSLVGSRSFAIDDYYGFGMVPLADLFNHKTGAEDVHFTSVCSLSDSDDGNGDDENNDIGDEIHGDPITDDKSSISDSDGKSSDDPTKLEMILVKGVEAGAEIFNTYGSMGNAALLHRYGFTEPDNPFDIVNIDLQLVVQWSTSSFSSRCFRRRLSLWRRLNYSGCTGQNSEYFEITIDGVPQLELLVLLYIILLTEEAYKELDRATDSLREVDAAERLISLINICKTKLPEIRKNTEEYLLTEEVCNALVALADAREWLYGPGSLEVDFNKLATCCCVSEKKLYHSLTLRVNERAILERLRSFASRFRKARSRKMQKSLKRKR